MSYSKPDLIIQGVLIDRMTDRLTGRVSHYRLRSQRPDGQWQAQIVSAGLSPFTITSKPEPIPLRLDDQAEIEFLTKVINGEDL